MSTQKPGTWMLTEALLKIVKICMQPGHPSVGEWIPRYIKTIEY